MTHDFIARNLHHLQLPQHPLALQSPVIFRSAPPTVQLLQEESTAHPFAVTVAAAWSCYGGKPAKAENVLKLVYGEPSTTLSAEKLAAREDRRDRAIKLYADLFAAGHHTTFQHSTFIFVLDNVSRLAIWSFFHSHPFYNSEQVSQRYREVTGETMTAPDLPVHLASVYDHAIQTSFDAYTRIGEILTPDFERLYAQVFPARSKAQGDAARARVANDVQKRAQEVARYVLPLATPAHLYHTVNGLTLLRYYVLANQPDAPTEVRYIVNQMISQVLEIDPYFLGGPGHPLDLTALSYDQTLEAQALIDWRANLDQHPDTAERFFEDYDAQLGGLNSKLVSYNPEAEHVFADAIRTVMGLDADAVSDEDAIARVLDGSQNAYHGNSVFLGMHSKLMQTMNHVPFTFQKRISCAEDAQNQRHRGTPGSSPLLTAHLRRNPDVITPWAIRQNPEAHKVYSDAIQTMWDAKNQLLAADANPETALYLLPNSHNVRFHESGSLLNYYWKWIKRLCLDAQREISETAWQEVKQVRDVHPIIGKYVDGPPCVMRSRAGRKPICPEGERYCGIPVWRNYELDDLSNKRVM
ncbi:MAG: FAD-dependent thymidylate synthase [Thermomicrobiales bacterium]|nr:FAD-dependent thymidylate synthase [Thermomicrobiales bacterium]